MDDYRPMRVLFEGPNMKSYLARSKHYEIEVLVKEYQCYGIMSAEPLMKEALRQAREKPQESAVLINVMFGGENALSSDFTVNFILEKKAEEITRDIIERDDRVRANRSAGTGHTGFSGHKELIDHVEGSASRPPGYRCYKTLTVKDNIKVEIARNISDGKEVVIKSLIELFYITGANYFIREAFVQAFVEHERNCKILDIYFTEEDKVGSTKTYSNLFNVHLVMERMQRDLKQDIRNRETGGNRHYSEAKLLTILKDVTSGLAHAKSLRIAHRDIKPENIFVDTDDRVKLGDFGSTWEKIVATMTISAEGTLGYMSPEMRKTMVYPYTNSVNPFISDVYSLGVTILHLALLKQPSNIGSMKSGTIEKDLSQIIRENRYSENLKQLILDMISIQPLSRPTLETVFRKTEELLSAFNQAAQANLLVLRKNAEEQKQVSINKMCNLTRESVRFFNFEERKWMDSVHLSSKISVDEATFYILDNVTIYYFGNLNFTRREAGAVEFDGSKCTVRTLPNMSNKRSKPGGIKYDEELYIFGDCAFEAILKQLQERQGIKEKQEKLLEQQQQILEQRKKRRPERKLDTSELELKEQMFIRKQRISELKQQISELKEEQQQQVSKSAEVLSLSAPFEWLSLPKMSEFKYSFNPVLYREKIYLCGPENIDVFDPQTRTFDPVLPLQIPLEKKKDRVACMYEDQLLIFTRTRLHRVSLTSSPPMIKTSKLKKQPVEPVTNAVVWNEFLYWATWEDCRMISLRHPSKIENF